MEYGILGPLEVVEHGQRLPLGGVRQRALLAVLLLHRREVVSLAQLIEALWGDNPPLTAVKTIQVYVSRLRKVLGAEVLETCGRGYRLAVDVGSCDLDRFDALLAQGRAALELDDPARAVELLGHALALWRDPALDEFSAAPFAEAELAHLAEARLAALEDRIDAALAMGRGPELVVELAQLAEEHPLRSGWRQASCWPCTGRGGRRTRSPSTARRANGWSRSSGSSPRLAFESSSDASPTRPGTRAAPGPGPQPPQARSGQAPKRSRGLGTRHRPRAGR